MGHGNGVNDILTWGGFWIFWRILKLFCLYFNSLALLMII